LLQVLEGDREMQRAVIESLQYSPSAEVRRLAAARGRLDAWRDEPPDFSYATFDSGPVNLADLRGKVVLIDLWSNFCGGCILAMPKLQKLYEQYRGAGLEVLGVWLESTVNKNEYGHKDQERVA